MKKRVECNMNIIILGQQGAGKGEYSQRLKEKYNILHISTGNLLRDEINKKTEIGLKIKEVVESGKLVDDETITEVLRKRLEKDDYDKGFILDGYPRNLNQAEMLDNILQGLNKKLDLAINLLISDNESIERLSNRRTCKKCDWVCNLKNIPPKKPGVCDKCGGELYQRDDDKEESIRKRLEDYRKKTKPLINYYRQKGILKDVNADRDYRLAMKDLEKILDDLK